MQDTPQLMTLLLNRLVRFHLRIVVLRDYRYHKKEDNLIKENNCKT